MIAHGLGGGVVWLLVRHQNAFVGVGTIMTHVRNKKYVFVAAETRPFLLKRGWAKVVLWGPKRAKIGHVCGQIAKQFFFLCLSSKYYKIVCLIRSDCIFVSNSTFEI